MCRHAVPSYIDLLFDGAELVLRSGQLVVGFVQSLSFGFHLAVHLVELDDVYNPRAQTGGCERLGRHQVWLELGILEHTHT